MRRAPFLLLLALVVLHAATDAALVSAQTPPAPTLTSATSDGTFVLLRWTLLPDYRLRYRVEAGSASGLSDLAVIDAGNYVSEYRAYTVPAGTYYVRVRSVLGDVVSAPSNEVVLTVAGCPRELPPLALEGVVQELQSVWLSWSYTSPPPFGCGGDSYQVEAGSGPGAVDIGVFRITGFVGARFQGVPFGTYYVRVRALRNGVAGPASNEVTLPVLCAAPPPIVDARATVVGNAARFTWSYGQTSASEFGVTLEAGSSPGAADLAAIPVPRVASSGFNAAGVAGTYFTRLRASNACGATVSSEIPVTLTSACPVPGYVPFVGAGLADNGVLWMEWQRVAGGGLESSYRVEVGSAPGQSDLADRVVDGHSVPEFGFRETFSGIIASRAYVRVTPLNSCGPGPSSIEVQVRPGCGMAPPRDLTAWVTGRRVTLRWDGVPESEAQADDLLEIGTTVYASNVLTTIVFSRGGYPGLFSTDLAPGRYFARVRRLNRWCGERSYPSPEVSFEIVP